MKIAWASLAIALSVLVSAPAHAGSAAHDGSLWQRAATDADIERAFTTAKAGAKPVLLYWGASWCPPCNQLQATLFNRQDFIERARAFVPVYVDGDAPGAQRLGSRFKVRGYPTLVLLNAQGGEITRLPGEADATQVMSVLQLGMSSGRGVKAVYGDARAGKPLQPNEWQLLAFYGWYTDDEQLVPASERPAALADLAQRCPMTERQAASRLLLKALAESEPDKGLNADEAVRERVAKLLADADTARELADVLTIAPAEIVKALAPAAGDARQRVVAAYGAALQRLQADASLSRADRLAALYARVELARIEQDPKSTTPKLPASLLDEVRAQAARWDQEIGDGYERQAVIPSAADLLAQAGLWGESDALLKSNLAKSHAPYYLMSGLASNARKLGRNDEALGWYEKAYAASQGPATRLQWGASYVSALVDLAPQDARRIETAAAAVLGEANGPSIFYERNARSLQRMARKLVAWNKDDQHADAMRKLKATLERVCAKVDTADEQRASCSALFSSAAAPT
jgi:thioredoxin-like negative regulator of GroEL